MSRSSISDTANRLLFLLSCICSDTEGTSARLFSKLERLDTLRPRGAALSSPWVLLLCLAGCIQLALPRTPSPSAFTDRKLEERGRCFTAG